MWLQKVRQAPARKLYVGCLCPKLWWTAKALPDFCEAVTDKEKFRRRLSESVQARAALIGDRSQSAIRLPALTHSRTRSLTHYLFTLSTTQPITHRCSRAQALIAAVSGDSCLGRDLQV